MLARLFQANGLMTNNRRNADTENRVGMRIDPTVATEIDNKAPITDIPMPMMTITIITTNAIRTTVNIKMGIPRNACVQQEKRE